MWLASLWLSWIIGGLVAGLVSGAVAVWASLRKGQPGLGMVALVMSCIAGAAGGVIAAVPVSLAFVWLISRRSRRAQATAVAETGAPVPQALTPAPPSPVLDYAGMGATGANDGWRYAASGMLIAYFWFVIGVPVAAAIVLLSESQVSPYWTFVALLSSHVFMMAGLLLAVRRIHHRPLITLLNVDGKIRWKKGASALGIWLGVIAALSAAEMVLRPGHAVFSLDMSAFVPFAVFALPLILMQSTAEELLFRGFLVQGLSMATRRRAVVATVSSLLFVAVHFPSTVAMASYYFIFGLFLTWVALRDQGLESVIGIHVGHNLLALLLLPSFDSVFPFAEFPSVFRVISPTDAFSLAQLVLAMAAFAGLYFGLEKRARLQPAVVPTAAVTGA